TRKLRVHPIARPARFAVADSIREHDEKLGRIERLIFSEKLAREFRADKLRTVAGGSVHDQNRIARLALVVFVDLAERPIMNPQLRQAFTGSEFETADDEIGFGWPRIFRRSHVRGDRNRSDN